MNITFSLTKDEVLFFTKCYTKYVNITTSQGLPVYSRSYFIKFLATEWYAKQNLKEITKK